MNCGLAPATVTISHDSRTSPPAPGASVPFRVLVDGRAPGEDHGIDVGEDGSGTLSEQRLHGLVRQQGPIRDRTLEISFLAGAGTQAFVFTFG